MLALLCIALCVGVWELAAYCLRADYLLPRFSDVMVHLGTLWSTKSFYVSAGKTILRCLAGFVVAFAAGVLFGIIGGICKPVRSFLKPIVAFFRAAPIMGLTLILLVWFTRDVAPAVVGFLMVFPIIYATVADSIATVDPNLLQMAKVYRLTKTQTLRYVYLPHITPMLFSASSTAFALNIKATVSAEVMAHTVGSIGMGMYIAFGDILESAASLFAWLLLAVLLSVLFEWLIKGLQALVTRRYRRAS